MNGHQMQLFVKLHPAEKESQPGPMSDLSPNFYLIQTK
jgi:hypothetical protein